MTLEPPRSKSGIASRNAPREQNKALLPESSIAKLVAFRQVQVRALKLSPKDKDWVIGKWNPKKVLEMMRSRRQERLSHLEHLEMDRQVARMILQVAPDYFARREQFFRKHMTNADRQVETRTHQLEIALEIGREAAYRRKIRLGTRKALARARRDGVQLGRPSKKLNLKRLAKLRARRLSHTQIAAMMGVSQSSISRALAKLRKGKP